MSLTSMKLANSPASQSTLSPYQTPDTVAVKVYLEIPENHTTNLYKSILVRYLKSASHSFVMPPPFGGVEGIQCLCCHL